MPASREMAADRDRWAAAKLLTYFVPKTGRWVMPTGEAWQPALALEAVLNSYERTRDVAYLNVIEKSFARYRGRRSHFFDDDGWYLNAWLRAYDVTSDPKYRAEARSLFAGMTDGWDERCGGGLWWNRGRTYKNAITNELFLLAAARLHRRTQDASYLGWATRAWAWFAASGMINDADLVNDGLDSSCANNGGAVWTYNQGVILGGLVELWRNTGDRGFLARAQRIADTAIRNHPEGILREPCEPRMDNRDAHLFKGIFAQGLARLYDADRDARPDYGSFLAANADAAWESARDTERGLGMSWRGPVGPVTAATHTSACLLFGHVALLGVGGETTRVPRLGGTVHEAEEATLGGVGVEALYPGFSGAGYVAHWADDGQYVSFTVDADSERTHTLTFRYSAGAGDAYRYLEVDGVGRAQRLLFAGTGAWGSYSTVSLDVPVRRGVRTVSLIYDSSRASRNFVNLDNLLVR